jgi:hypothetical protein
MLLMTILGAAQDGNYFATVGKAESDHDAHALTGAEAISDGARRRPRSTTFSDRYSAIADNNTGRRLWT